MYLYPKDLKAKPMMWFWYLKDIVMITIISIIAILLLVYTQSMVGLAIATVYAILTTRLEDASILDFIKYACIFFCFSKQSYKWEEK